VLATTLGALAGTVEPASERGVKRERHTRHSVDCPSFSSPHFEQIENTQRSPDCRYTWFMVRLADRMRI
jgi:hypothetical protein